MIRDSLLTSSDSGKYSRLGLGCWLAVFAVAALLYIVTSQRGSSWQDNGMFQWRVLNGQYANHLGLALAHPLYIAAGRVLGLISQDNLPLLLNAFSGVGMAVVLANLAAIVTLLTGKRWAGVLSASILGLAHTSWWLATITETYTWSLALFSIELLLLIRLLGKPKASTLAWLAGAAGVGLCIHNFALLALPVYAIVAITLIIQKKISAWSLPAAAGAFVLGAGLFLAMIVDYALSDGLLLAVKSALVGNYAKAVLNVSSTSSQFSSNIILMGINCIGPIVPLAIVGWVRFRKILPASTALCIGAITVIHAAFVLRYSVPDQFTFLLPTLLMCAISAGVGLSVLADISRKAKILTITSTITALVVSVVFFATAPLLARSLGRNIVRQGKPYRDELRYWLTPWKVNEDSAEKFAADALSIAKSRIDAGANGVIILCDSTALHPLLIIQKFSYRSDNIHIWTSFEPITSISDASPDSFRKSLAGREIYVVSLQHSAISEKMREDYRFIPIGKVLFKMELKTR